MSISFADEPADPNSFLPPAPQVRAASHPIAVPAVHPAPVDFPERIDAVRSFVESRGFAFEPWQIAAFITAVRTKPFVILAGISGTGKTKLPKLVADATGAKSVTIPVRPDWTDSSDLLGFERLNGVFQPGHLLRVAKEAQENPEQQYFIVLDEMNIARVEYYLAEVLSRIEERVPDGQGRLVSERLVSGVASADIAGWGDVRLTSNLCIIGSVNMDETTHGFSRKVLDRAFVIEFSTVDLTAFGDASLVAAANQWTSADWAAPVESLALSPRRTESNVQSMIETLTKVNAILERAQLQFGFRLRDETVAFCLAAQEYPGAFTTSGAGAVDPLDLAIAMKILPRIQGGGATINSVLEALLDWAAPTSIGSLASPGGAGVASFPFCAARIRMMITRLRESGFTSYWL